MAFDGLSSMELILSPGDFVDLRADLVPAGVATEDIDEFPWIAEKGETLVYRGTVTVDYGRFRPERDRHVFSSSRREGRLLEIRSEPTFGVDHRSGCWYMKANAGDQMVASWLDDEQAAKLIEHPSKTRMA